MKIGSNLEIMPSLTKIRSRIILSADISGKVFILQGFVVKFFKKTVTEGCNLIEVHHEGDQYGDYNVSSVIIQSF